MTEQKFIDIFKDEDIKAEWEWDNALQWIDILCKYFDKTKENIICWAWHDELYSVEIEELCKRWITKEDIIKLSILNWSEQAWYLICFV